MYSVMHNEQNTIDIILPVFGDIYRVLHFIVAEGSVEGIIGAGKGSSSTSY